MSGCKFNKYNDLLFKLFFVFIVALVISPLILPGISPGMDWLYHIVRIESIKEGVLNNEFPVKIHSLPINGYGYASGIFYPQIFIYIPALFRIIGLSIEFANKLFILLIMCLRAATSYYSGKYICKNKYVAMCITMMLMISPLIIYKIYMLLSYGDMIGAIFSPLVICGAYNLIYEDFDKPYLLGIGFLGLACSHIISTVMMLIAVIMMVLFNIRSVFGDVKKVIKLLLTAVCDIILTAFMWVPILEQMLSSKFSVSYPWRSFVERSKLFKMCMIYLSPYFPKWLIATLIALLVTAIIYLSVKFISRIKNLNTNHLNEKKFVLDLMMSSLVLMFCMTDVFPWFLFEKVFGFMQFTSRLFYIVELFLCFCIPIGLSLIFGNKINKLKVFCSIFSVLLLSDVILFASLFKMPIAVNDETISRLTQVNQETIEDDNGWIFTYDIGWGKEYLPLDTDIKLLDNQNTVISSEGKTFKLKKYGSSVQFSPNEGVAYFEVPRLFYKGYQAVGIDGDDKSHLLKIEKGSNNVIKIFCDGVTYNKIKVSYSGTLAQHISEVVSVLFAVILLLIFIFFYRHQKRVNI